MKDKYLIAIACKADSNSRTEIIIKERQDTYQISFRDSYYDPLFVREFSEINALLKDFPDILSTTRQLIRVDNKREALAKKKLELQSKLRALNKELEDLDILEENLYEKEKEI